MDAKRGYRRQHSDSAYLPVEQAAVGEHRDSASSSSEAELQTDSSGYGSGVG